MSEYTSRGYAGVGDGMGSLILLADMPTPSGRVGSSRATSGPYHRKHGVYVGGYAGDMPYCGGMPYSWGEYGIPRGIVSVSSFADKPRGAD